MRTKQILVERNFHLSNGDRYLMEKISQTIELDENDLGFEQAAMDAARQSIVDNFKHAYPDVNHDLNFNKNAPQKNHFISTYPTMDDYKINQEETPVKQKDNADDVLKASLKEMMECKTQGELKGFEIWARANDAGDTYDTLFKKLSA